MITIRSPLPVQLVTDEGITNKHAMTMTHNSSSIPQQLIGFWKVIGGDYPLVDEYRSDGVLVQHVGDQASDPIPVRVEGDFLVARLEQPDGTMSEQKERFELSGDHLSFIASDGSKRSFQRVSAVEHPSSSQKPWWRFW